MNEELNIVDGSIDAYRKFYERVPEATRFLFNSPDFLSYRGNESLTFLDWRNGSTSFAQSAVLRRTDFQGAGALIVPGGASFGGPVAHRNLRIADYLKLLGALVEYAREHNCARIEWTPPMPHHVQDGHEEAEFAALKLGFRVETAGLESVVILPPRENSKLQNLLRKCQREGVTYCGDIDLDRFYPTLEGVYARHKVNPTHSYKDLAILKQRFPERIRFIGAARAGELAATACLFRISDTSELVFYMCTVDEHKKSNPMLLLIAEDMARSREQGCVSYNFGTSSVELEMRANVWEFKKQFGAVGFLRRRFVWVDLGD